MDGHPRRAQAAATELGLQTASLTTHPRRAGRCRRGRGRSRARAARSTCEGMRPGAGSRRSAATRNVQRTNPGSRARPRSDSATFDVPRCVWPVSAGFGPSRRIARGRSVLVRAERVRRRARVADRRRRVEIAQGDRDAPVREQALDVVQALGAALELDQPPERAALDPLGREPVRIRAPGATIGSGRAIGGWRASTGAIGPRPIGRRTIAPRRAARQHAKRTRLPADHGGRTRRACGRRATEWGPQAGPIGRRGRVRSALRRHRSPTGGTAICPILALEAADGALADAVPLDTANRCTALGGRRPPVGRQQELVCLTAAHANCPRYLRGRLLARLRRRPPGRQPIARP